MTARYFGKFNKARQDRWVLGDRQSGAYMHRFSWTKIVRHLVVKSGASPDDPALADYWAWRRRKPHLPINGTTLRLLQAQDGRCPICRDVLLHDDNRPRTPREWEQWLATTRKTMLLPSPTKTPSGCWLITGSGSTVNVAEAPTEAAAFHTRTL